jgi:RimJ/RimL family protein N-acetyltransferase
VVLPEELLPELITVGDLYHYAQAPGPRSAPPGPAPFRRGVLELLGPADEAAAFSLMSRGEHLTRFRLRGTTPSPETFHHHLWDRVLVQFAVRYSPGSPMIGLVTAFDPDLRNRHVHLAAVASEASLGTGLVASAAMHTVDYLFREFDLRKVYAEALASNLEQFASGTGRYFEVQGRLTGHEFIDGRYEDVVILATTRARWAALR